MFSIRKIIKCSFFFPNFYWSCFAMLCQFLLYSKVNRLYVYTYPLFLRFPSHFSHHRSLSRVPCAIQQVLISYFFYTQQCVYAKCCFSVQLNWYLLEKGMAAHSIILAGKPHRQRSLMGYNSWGPKSQTQLSS